MYPRRAVIFIEKDVKFLEISRRFTEEVIKTIGCKISLKTKKKKDIEIRRGNLEVNC